MRHLKLMTTWCRISTLELPWCDMNGQEATWLSGVLTQYPALVHLDLNRNRIGAGGTDSLAGVLGQCTALTHLDLSYNCICKSPGAEESIARVLGQCTMLAHLDLSTNSTGPVGAESLRVLKQCWCSSQH